MDRYHEIVFPKKDQKNITTRPGVYLYFDEEGNVIYVGKAKNLRNRIRQYFAQHYSNGARFTHDHTSSPKTRLLVSRIASLKTIPTDSEFDAILLEATLIRRYLPKYNAIAKDDKSPLYIVMTFDETLPHVLPTRKTTIDSVSPLPKRRFIAGPFQSGRVARLLMRSIRRIIPYCTQRRRDGLPCFYTHIGLCNPCPSVISTMPYGSDRTRLTRTYRNNIRRIAFLLSGHARRVRIQLERAMRSEADRMAFEEAGAYKRQLNALDMLLTHAFDPSVYTDSTSMPGKLYQARITELIAILHLYGLSVSLLDRIECIDISTIQGHWATGSLVVFINGLPNTDEYRRFRIKISGRPNDVGMMAEVVSRRFTHPEWPFPDLLIVDGGKPQVRAAKNAIQAIPATQEIPIIGLAKRFEEIIVPEGKTFRIIRLSAASPALQLLQHIRDEAHRFAKKYHMFLRTI